MGLLTGFSIISGVEILYFACKIALVSFNNFRKKKVISDPASCLRQSGSSVITYLQTDIGRG